MLADAGENVLQRPPRGIVIEDVVGRDRRHLASTGKVRQAVEPRPLVRAEKPGEREIEPVAERRLEEAKPVRQRIVRPLGKRDQDLPFAVGCEILGRNVAFPLGRAALAEGQKTGETRIGRAVHGIAEDGAAIVEIEPAADHKPEPRLLGRHMGADDACEAVAVGDAHGRMAQGLRHHHQFVGMARPAQEGEIAGDLQIGVAHQPKIP